jgi:hypothetical protein
MTAGAAMLPVRRLTVETRMIGVVVVIANQKN